MGQWTDEYDIWVDELTDQRYDLAAALGNITNIDTVEVGWTAGELNDNFLLIQWAFYGVHSAIATLINENNAFEPMRLIIQELTGLMDAGFGEAEPITWKDIMKAWWDAPIAGWGWTIQFIDFMRKAVWNEPMNIIEQEEFM